MSKNLFKIHRTMSYDNRTIKDIFRRAKINTKDQLSILYKRILTDNETPEMLAYSIYGDVNKHWVILLFNNVIDPHFDWLLSENEVYRLAEGKYGVGNLDDVHHYVDDEDNSVWDDRSNDPGGNGLTAVSNIQHEINENELKREVFILDPTFVDEFIENYEATVK